MGKAVAVTLLGLLAAAPFGASALAGDGAAPPPFAHPGECYGRARLPGPTRVWRERVQVSRGGDAKHVVPAQYAWSSRRVLVRAAWTQTIPTAAVYRTVVDRVREPGVVSYVSTPARYRQVVERRLVAPARLEWVRKTGRMGYGEGEPGAQTLIPTGEILCRVRVPARYETRVRQVMVAPPGRRRVVGPARIHCVSRRELVKPAGAYTRPHAAEYRIERTRALVRPARVEWSHYGPSFRTVSHVRGGDSDGWARVLCPGGLAPWAMQRLQGNLDAQGYDAGPADGVGKPQTYQALQRFQRDHRLAVGPITTQSAQALGVVP